MAAGVTTKLWKMEDVVAMIEAEEGKISKLRGPYSKKMFSTNRTRLQKRIIQI